MPARMTYLVCRKAEDRPEGVTYFDGTWSLSKTRTFTAVIAGSRMFRREAWEGDEASARLVADILTKLGTAAGLPDAPKWEAMPAAIYFEEAEKLAQKAAEVAPEPTPPASPEPASPEADLAFALANFAVRRGLGIKTIREALRFLGAEGYDAEKELHGRWFPADHS